MLIVKSVRAALTVFGAAVAVGLLWLWVSLSWKETRR